MKIKKLFFFASLVFSAGMASAQSYSYSYVERADSAERYIRLERWEDAERNLKAALRLEPGNPGNALLLSNLGYVQSQLGHTNEAIDSYTVSLSIAPRSAVVLSNRGLAYLQAKRYDEAMSDLNASLAIDSVRAMPLRGRGMLRFETGDIDGAKSDFLKLSKIDSKDPAAFSGLARCFIAEGKWSEALVNLSKALELDPTEELFFLKASVEIDMGELPTAAETLREAIKKFPREGDLYLLRAKLHQLNYRPADAAIDRKTALSLGSDPETAKLILQK